VKTPLFAVLLIIPLVFACAPKKPDVTLTEVPAGPLVQALDQRHRSFHGMKAVASIVIQKWGKKRVLENVGIVLDGQCRFRMEAYGPLGQTITAFVWNGRTMLLRRPDSDRVEQQGEDGFARLLGQGLNAREFCAILSGNIPELARPYRAVQLCGRDGGCVLEISRDDSVRRVQVVYPAATGMSAEAQIVSQELHQSGDISYRVRFDRTISIASYRFPTKIEIEVPDRHLQLTIEYDSDLQVDIPIQDELFEIPNNETAN